MGFRVGIDLGTTNSVIAYTELGRQRCQRVEANEYTSAILPSCVGLLSNGEVVVGNRARRARERVSEFKRGMGSDRAWQLGDDLLTAVELSALVLRRLREGFEAAVGEIEGAVITVPALFDDRQRRETVEAGRLAGLHVLRVINEPSAAAIAYSLSDRPPGHNAVVVDWGGGTFDVSLLDLEDDVLDVKANAGDLTLGGKDIDQVIVDRMLATLARAGHDVHTSREALAELGRLAEQVKIHLSDHDVWDDPIVLQTPNVIADFQLTRTAFESAVTPLLERGLAVVREVLARNPGRALRPDEVGDVIFVGGSCRMPIFQQRIEALFGRPGRDSIDPMEVVALGAAYQAEHATSSSAAQLLTIHSLARNLGVRSMGADAFGVARTDLFTILLRAGSKIPARHTESFSTTHDNQTAVDVEIYELDTARERVTGKPLDRRTIRGIPAAPAGSFEIRVTFDYSVDQRLDVRIDIPRFDIEQRWVLEHERKLEAGRAVSEERVARVFAASLDPFVALAARVRGKLAGRPGATRSAAALAALDRALDDGDAAAAGAAKTELLSALFDEGVPLS